MIAAVLLWPPISATKRPPGLSARRTPARTASGGRIQWSAAFENTASNSRSKVRFCPGIRRSPPCSRLHPLGLACQGLAADLRQCRARRDDLRVHLELDDRGTSMGSCLLESRRELFGSRYRSAERAIGSGEGKKIWVLQRGPDYPAGEAALLMHADGAVHRVVEYQNDRSRPFQHRGRQLLPGHHKAAVAAKADDQAVGIDELGGDRGGHAVTHRPAGRPELTSWPAVLQKAVGPAAEIAGVAGDDRVVGKAIAQPPHDFAEIEQTAGARRGGGEPGFVVGARRLAPGRPPRHCLRRQCRDGSSEFGHARLDRESWTKHATELFGGSVH